MGQGEKVLRLPQGLDAQKAAAGMTALALIRYKTANLHQDAGCGDLHHGAEDIAAAS